MKLILKPIASIISPKYISKKIIKLAKSNDYNNSSKLGTYVWGYGMREILDRKCFEGEAKVKFEDIEAAVIIGYKDYLTSVYGDYMKSVSYTHLFAVLQKINMMNEEELVQYRIKNKEHNERIQKRKVRNFISATIKRCIDIITGLVGTITLVPITVLVWIMKKINKEDGPRCV